MSSAFIWGGHVGGVLFKLVATVTAFAKYRSGRPTKRLPQVSLATADFTFSRMRVTSRVRSVRCIPLRLASRSLVTSMLSLYISSRCVFICSAHRSNILRFSQGKGCLHYVTGAKGKPKRAKRVVSLAMSRRGHLFYIDRCFSASFCSFSKRFVGGVRGPHPCSCRFSINPGAVTRLKEVCIPVGAPNVFDLKIFG